MDPRDLRRFLVEELPAAAGQVVIRGSEARHIALVLRMRAGDELILGDRKGSHFLAKIESAERDAVRVALLDPCPPPAPSPVEITLGQAVLKSQAMDTLIQKVSELGAERVVPFFSERTVVRLDRERVENKLRRWQEVARGAAKQCGRATPLEIRPPLAFRDLLAAWDSETACKILLWEREAEADLQSRLAGPEHAGYVSWGWWGPREASVPGRSARPALRVFPRFRWAAGS